MMTGRNWLALAVATLLAGCGTAPTEVAAIGDPHEGARLVERQACGSCHLIPGIPLADGKAGPPLAGVGSRIVIAGSLPNSAANMTRWLRHPQKVQPGSAMPDMGLSEREARDIAAFLYGLR